MMAMKFVLHLEAFRPVARELLERESKRRGCSSPQLLEKLADRYLKDKRLKRKLTRLFDKVLVRYKAEKDASDLLQNLDEPDWITLNMMLMSQSERKRGFQAL